MSARVLVVDDVSANVKLLEAKLTREYFEVLTASDGYQALEKAEREQPDIILLDVMMPGMDGFEVCEKLKANPATQHLPVVMVTALSDTSDKVRGLEVGADDFLTKPVNDTALFSRVRSLTRLKMMMDEWRARESTSNELGVIERGPCEIEEDGTSARILVVEDSAMDRDRIETTLQQQTHTLTVVETGAAALQALSGTVFDLIIISLTLIDEDGLRLCSQMRSQERTRQIPILLLADDGDLDRTAKGLELGANDYLVKPIERSELLARVRTQIRRKRYQDRLRQNYEESLSMALTDSLTGLFNRRYLTTHLERIIQRIAETRKPVSAILFDIDHFKVVNDTYGHGVGDEVLKEIADRVSRNLRNFDMVARMGGEEFVIIMPEAPIEAASFVAERLRMRIANEPFKVSASVGQLDISVSLGVAAVHDAGADPDSLIERADKALYAAKAKGRNCVVAEGLDEI